MENNESVNLFVSTWGLDKTCYIAAWCTIGIGVGFLIGYSTKNLI